MKESERPPVIGLLECDHVRQDLLEIGGDYRDMFPKLFNDAGRPFLFRFYDVVNGVFPDNARECDGYICTGSSFSVYEDVEWIKALSAFVRQLNAEKIPYVGVCFGHQMLAHALGGVVRKASSGWCVGVHEFVVAQPLEDWMRMPVSRVNLLMMCQDQVLVLPENTRTLASTADCPNAMISTGSHMLGIQGHPEFSPAYNEALIILRRERIGEKKSERGIESLKLKTDHAIIAGWIADFFGNLRKRN